MMNVHPRHGCAVVLLALLLALQIEAGHAQAISIGSALVRQDTLPLGGAAEGTILVRNGTSTPREVRAYQTDLTSLPNGATDYGEPGKHPRSNAGWMAIVPKQLTVPAKGSALISYVIRVPADDALKGTYWSVIMVEGIAPASLRPPKDPAKPVYTVGTVMRYAIQVITNIGDSGTRDLRFADKQIVTLEGKRLLQLAAQNVGERILRPTLWAELYDAQGSSMGRLEGGRKGLYPGDSYETSFDLSKFPAGKYTALVVADNGDEAVFGAQYDLELE